MGPTDTPTDAPTGAPTYHPCDDGTHGCDTGPGGICMKTESGWACGCAEGYKCVEGCYDDHAGHTCMLTEAPTDSPTDTPTAEPTDEPTKQPTDAPTKHEECGCTEYAQGASFY